jgi:hypothetical protein
MDPEDMMPVDLDLASMWTLSEDSTEVRLALPPIALEGLPKPLELFVAFDAKAWTRSLLGSRCCAFKCGRAEMACDGPRP